MLFLYGIIFGILIDQVLRVVRGSDDLREQFQELDLFILAARLVHLRSYHFGNAILVVSRKAFSFKLRHNYVKEHFLKNSLRLSLSDQLLVLRDEQVQHQFGDIGDLELQLGDDV